MPDSDETDIVPKRCRKAFQHGLHQKAIELGIAEEKNSSPYALAMSVDERNVPEWYARNYMLAGSALVTLEKAGSGNEFDPEPAQTYDAFLAKLKELSHWLLPVSQYTWLVGSQESAATLHREISSTVDVLQYSFTVLDLNTGLGIGWNSTDGVMSEIEPVKLVPEDE